MLRGEIDSTDQAIDTLVYQLYDLTEAEIKIVEGGLPAPPVLPPCTTQ